MTEREAFTSALAGPLAKARATSAGVAPCAPTPGRSRTDCGSARRASPIARGWVAPTTAPTLERPCSPTRSSPHSRTRRAAPCPNGAHAVGAERLEERELRLHPDDVRCDRVDESAAEARARLRGVLPPEVRVAAQ